ncbi:unnamed protein product [Plutella xylostella]|uniref:(diamondback moth) hypothetical protein n=1 Tax=Plutella xylostella TaxID=51655 RepID=A0A8S4EPM8_PLUXY|nr:unnamed protein product [Plutella xylostella]
MEDFRSGGGGGAAAAARQSARSSAARGPVHAAASALLVPSVLCSHIARIFQVSGVLWDCGQLVLMKRSTWVDVEAGGRLGCNGEIFWSECSDDCDCSYCNPNYVCVCSDKMETSAGSESSGGEDADARRSRRGHVLAELMQTERAYVQELRSIITVSPPPLPCRWTRALPARPRDGGAHADRARLRAGTALHHHRGRGRSRRGHVLAELMQTERAYVQELRSIITVSPPPPPPAGGRGHVLAELMQTERAYVQELRSIITVSPPPLQVDAGAPGAATCWRSSCRSSAPTCRNCAPSSPWTRALPARPRAGGAHADRARLRAGTALHHHRESPPPAGGRGHVLAELMQTERAYVQELRSIITVSPPPLPCRWTRALPARPRDGGAHADRARLRAGTALHHHRESPPPAGGRGRSRRGHVLAELMQTERAYVQELRSIITVSPPPPPAGGRGHVLAELMQTERAYVQELRSIITVSPPPLQVDTAAARIYPLHYTGCC